MARLEGARAQQRPLVAAARECAAPETSSDPRALVERIVVPNAFFGRLGVVANKTEIEAAFSAIEQLRAAAAAHGVADDAKSRAAPEVEPLVVGAELQGELMAIAFGDADALDDAASAERRKRFSERMQTALVEKPKQCG